MKAENKQLYRDWNNKNAIIQALKANYSKRTATSLNENNNRIKAISDLHRADIVMKYRTIHKQDKELQEQRKISNIVSFFFFNYYLY